MTAGDTIAAVSTAKGPAAVAIVRLSGADAFAVAGRMTRRPLPSPGTFAFAKLFRPGAAEGDLHVDEALVLVFKGPRSYTGEDVVEFHCHGGAVQPERVLGAAFEAGARAARRGEFTERAFLNGKLSYDEAEAVLDLVNARTSRAADDALEGMAGGRRRAVERLYGDALSLSAEMEHSLDVDEEELPCGFVARIARDAAALRERILSEAKKERERRMFRRGASVVLLGPPNAGKSTLLNAILGEERAIVSGTPGTTRDVIDAWTDIGGWPVRLVDTAGVRETADPVEARGVSMARDEACRADVVILLGVACGEPFPDGTEVVRVHAKCDVSRGDGLNVSAVTGEGLEELKASVAAALERKAQKPVEADGDAARLSLLERAASVLGDLPAEAVPLANALRDAAVVLGSASGAVYSSDLLDNLFSRFCVGK